MRTAALVTLLALMPASLPAQQAPPDTTSGKKFSIFDTYPGTDRIKALITGDEFQAQAKGPAPLKGLRILTCTEDGRTNLIVRAPVCLFDLNTRAASSAGALQVETGNSQFTIEGEGFQWKQSDGVVNISNKVHAIIRKDALGASATNLFSTSIKPGAAAATNQFVHIYSDEFDLLSEKAVFRGHIRVEDAQGRITCGLLSVLFAQTNRQVQTIRAEQSVVIDFGETHATGEVATYELASDIVEIMGKPAWRIGLREGRAEELFIDRRSRDVRASRNVYLKMPPGAMGQSGFLLPQAVTKAGATKGTPLEIYADEGSFKSGAGETNASLAMFRGHVRVLHPEGRLNCGVMTMTTAAQSNRVERIVADENVTVEQGESRVTAERAVYSATNDTVELTGNPSWHVGERQGSAGWLNFDLKKKEYRASQDVRMRLPAGSLGNVAWLATRTNGAANAAAALKPPRPPIEISSDEFIFQNESPDTRHDTVIYRGQVKAADPGRMNLTCGVLTGIFLSGTNLIESVVAEQQVLITMLDTNGQRRANGDRVVYNAALQLLELRGAHGVEIVIADGSGESRATAERALYDAGGDTMELIGNARVDSSRGRFSGPFVYWNRRTGQLKSSGLASLSFKTGGTNQGAPTFFGPNPFGLNVIERKQ